MSDALKNKIVVRFAGGLGNQLFQYAAAFAYAKQYNSEVIFDLRFFTNYQLHGGFRLRNLNIKNEDMSICDEKLFPELWTRFYTKFPMATIFSNRWVHENIIKKVPLSQNNILLGYWQSERYFSNYKSELKELFQPKVKEQTIVEIATEMTLCNSVSLHVRRGDYVSNPTALKHHGICSIEYYICAINYISKYIESPVFYIFSDDMNWCKDHLSKILPKHSDVYYIENNTQEIDLYLMSNARHHIIANSSFSWWGAWLAQKENQIVIAPKPWFDVRQKYTPDPSLEEWIRFSK